MDENNNIAIIDYRGEIKENLHRVDLVVVNSEGEVLYGFGNIHKEILARSSTKPMQCVPVVESGAADAYQYTKKEISVTCASHSGERRHVDTVKGILEKAGLPVEVILTGGLDLQPKYGNPEGINDEPNNIRHNCSGKHSGMVATAAYLGEDITNYPDLDHPVQQRILDVIADITTYPRENIKIAIDGCGVPVHGLPMTYLAKGFARMTDPERYFDENRAKAISRVTDAMMTHPEMVAGEKRFCTEFMAAAKGTWFGKVGACGVYIAGDMKNKIGICAKSEEGNADIVASALLHAISTLGLDENNFVDTLEHWLKPKTYNARRQEVGQRVPIFTLKKGE